jgi:hypothetical protein
MLNQTITNHIHSLLGNEALTLLTNAIFAFFEVNVMKKRFEPPSTYSDKWNKALEQLNIFYSSMPNLFDIINKNKTFPETLIKNGDFVFFRGKNLPQAEKNQDIIDRFINLETFILFNDSEQSLTMYYQLKTVSNIKRIHYKLMNNTK